MQDRFRPLVEHLQQAASRHGVKELACELNKAPSSLYAELNPYDTQGKLGLCDAAGIMSLTGDHTALEMLAGMLGYRLVPVDGDPVQAETAYPTLAGVMAQAGELAIRLRDAMADGEISPLERAQLCEVAMHVMRALEPFAVTKAASRREVN